MRRNVLFALVVVLAAAVLGIGVGRLLAIAEDQHDEQFQREIRDPDAGARWMPW